jgi:hypothetical protein
MSTEPIKAGDLCEIVEGAMGSKGPNVGKRVRVLELRGEHSVHGRIWRVQGGDLVSEYGALGEQVDCAQAWLRKLPPEAPPMAGVQKVVSA